VKALKLVLTEDEKKALIKELAERMKDIVYMNAESRAQATINSLLEVELEPSDPIKINYKFNFVFNDILQILGRIRRKKEEEVKAVEAS